MSAFLSLQYGTAGWIAEKKNNINDIHLAKVSAVSSGPAYIQCSYRSELTGIMAGLCYVTDICLSHNVTHGEITIGCDGLGALDVLSEIIDPNITIKNNRNHFDLLLSIKQLLKFIPHITLKLIHIKAHQDDYYDFKDLNRLSQLNVLADRIAGDTMIHQISLGLPRHDSLPCDPCSIYIKRNDGDLLRICSRLMDTLMEEINKTKIRKYWIHKRKFTSRQEKDIDWEIITKCRNSLSKSKAIWGSKWLSGFCGVGRMLQLQRFQTHSKCPRCNMDNEDVIHVIQCRDTRATNLWNQELDKLKEWMLDKGGDPDLTNLIYSSLRSWRDSTPLPSFFTSDITLSQAILKQDAIGWKSFVDGFLVKEWRIIQHRFMKSKRDPRSSILWMIRLQKRIWEIPWLLWEHRNNILHGETNSDHIQNKRDTDLAIIKEWNIGTQNLSRQFHTLFRGEINERLQDSPEYKRLWLMSVWSARSYETQRSGTRSTRDSSPLRFYDGWKAHHVNRT